MINKLYLHFFNGIPLDETRNNSAWDTFGITNVNLLNIESVSIVMLLAGNNVANTNIETRNNWLLRCSRSWWGFLLLFFLCLFLLVLLLLWDYSLSDSGSGSLNSSLNLSFALLLLFL
jgi:hypothetical protein